jgi:hypothetical protein
MGTARLAAAALLVAATPAAAQLWEVGNRILWQPGGASGARFGAALATGDFDDDGYTDLAVGAPGTSGGTGRVDVYRGGSAGLSTTIWQSIPGEADSRFGAALVAADFDGDGRDELAVGSPEHDEPDGSGGFFENSGRISVFELVSGNWTFTGVLSQAGDGAGALEVGDEVGGALAAGDFDDDGFADLAAGAAEEAVGSTAGSGAVNVFYGSAAGLTLSGSQIWNYGGDVDGAAQPFDHLGVSLATGDFDGDGVDDLAAGAWGRALGEELGAGAVVVLYGVAGSGLSATGQQSIDTDDLGLVPDSFGSFGAAVAAGDFNRSNACLFLGNCADDLAIGAITHEVEFDGETVEATGRVYVVRGTDPGGLDPALLTILDESMLGAEGVPASGDHFGKPIAAGAIDRRPGDDLVVGIPDDGDAWGSAGFFGGAGIAAGAPTQRLWARPGFESAPPSFPDAFGSSLAIGDFDGDGTGDLAVGLPGRDSPDAFDAGVVQVLYGALFADGFERGDPDGWTAP